MLKSIFKGSKSKAIPKQRGGLVAALMAVVGMALAGGALPAHAQELETFDPDAAFEQSVPSADQVQERAGAAASSALGTSIDRGSIDTGSIDADIGGTVTQPQFRTAPMLDPVTGQPAPTRAAPVEPGFDGEFSSFDNNETVVGEPVPQWSDPAQGEVVANASEQNGTYGEDDLIGAAEGLFGKGAAGLAGLIEDLLRKQGEPNGYIVGREAGGAFIFGARYGSGTLHHKVEGERKVYWTGPSLGFDAGANAGNTFVLVYNLYDSEDLFRRYPAGEGQAYLVGGMHASYMRRGDVVLIPIRLGAGLRLGVNAGYMRFSKKHRWLPF